MSDYTPTTEEVRRNEIIRNGESCEVKFAEFDRWRVERDRQVAEKAWDRCVGEMPIDPDWKNFYTDNNPYREKGQ